MYALFDRRSPAVNRLSAHFSTEPTAQSGFVVCCLPTMVPAGQVALVAEVYRLAAEQTRRQLAPPRLRRVPEFSRN